jgi:oligogalacturonide lyase
MNNIKSEVGMTHCEPVEQFPDPATGNPVLRLTDLNTHCHHPYFYFNCFTPDGKNVLYISHRTGRAQAYLLNLESKVSTQLTDVENLVEFIISLSPDGEYLFYSAQNLLHRLKLSTFEDVVIYEQTPPFCTKQGGIYAGYNDDYTLAFACQTHLDDILPGGGWSTFRTQLEKKPRCRLVLIDLRTGKETVIREEACWFGHPQIRPGDSNTLLYCHEGPCNQVDSRIWTIKADGNGCRPLLPQYYKPEGNVGVFVSHESFMPDGRHVMYSFSPEVSDKDGSMRLFDLDNEQEIDLGRVSNYSHSNPSPDGALIVGDEKDKDRLPECKIWVFDIETRTETPVCLHGSSFKPYGNSTQDSHPHPAFSPDGRKILFSSDRETGAKCVVYLAEFK